jgi:hypothetical protein
MYLSGYKYQFTSGFMEFDHVTNRYLYPDRYIFLNYTQFLTREFI